MAEQDIRLQIQALEQLKIELENLIKDIEVRGNSYYEHVKALEQTGLDVNVTKKYEEQYWKPDYAMLNQLRQHIKDHDIKYVEQCLNGAKAALAGYTGNK